MIGTNTKKPKSTWTRINRIEFGPSGSTKPIALPGLGKRDTHETQRGLFEEEILKKGRLSNEEEFKDNVSAEVESHPCRE